MGRRTSPLHLPLIASAILSLAEAAAAEGRPQSAGPPQPSGGGALAFRAQDHLGLLQSSAVTASREAEPPQSSDAEVSVASSSDRFDSVRSGEGVEEDDEEAVEGRTRTVRIRRGPASHASLARRRQTDRYVVISVLSGRRSQEEILLAYLQKLLDAGSIDEILLTVVLDRVGEADSAWLHGLNRSDAQGLSLEEVDTFGQVYRYLAQTWKPPEGLSWKTVVLKCDDDIVYVDVEHFDGYVNYIATHQDMFLVFANVVNNGVAAFYQQAHGSIPLVSNGTDMQMPYPPDGLFGRLFTDRDAPAELHRLFLAGPERFSWRHPEHDGCIVYSPPHLRSPAGGFPGNFCLGGRCQYRFSINFFGYRFEERERVFEQVTAFHGDDELALTAENTRTNCMYTEFVVSHYAFGGRQRKDLDRTDILAQYSKLKDRMIWNSTMP